MNENIANKISSVAKQVGSLLPDKRNQSQNYDYISADKILERAGKALADAGIAVFPSVVNTSVDASQYTNKFGKPAERFDAIVTMSFVVSIGDDDGMTCSWVGAGSDFSVPDKAVYKAITSGHKYFLMKLLNIGVGNEDGEHETQPETPESVAPTKKAPAKKAATQSTGNIFDTVTSEDGILYKDMEISDLVPRFNTLEKQLKSDMDMEQHERDEKELKRDAARHFIEQKKG